jgi:hypothetical protein
MARPLVVPPGLVVLPLAWSQVVLLRVSRVLVRRVQVPPLEHPAVLVPVHPVELRLQRRVVVAEVVPRCR